MSFRSLVEETHVIEGGKVLCPSHDEATASCHIYDGNRDDKPHAHCYGCGWHADAIEWIKVVKGLDFKTARAEAAARGLAARRETGSLRDAPSSRGAEDRAERRSNLVTDAHAARGDPVASKNPALALYDASRRINATCGANTILIKHRCLWPDERRIPKAVRRLTTAAVAEAGHPTPKGSRGVLLYAFSDIETNMPAAVCLEAVRSDGVVVPWGGKEQRFLTLLPADVSGEARFLLRGKRNPSTVVLCEDPPTALAARWLHGDATTICTADGGAPSEFPEGNVFLAEGSQAWFKKLEDERWTWVERDGGRAEYDLHDIGCVIGAAHVALRVAQIGGDYRNLLVPAKFHHDPFGGSVLNGGIMDRKSTTDGSHAVDWQR